MAVLAMIYLGSGLMIYNIYGFIRFARYIKRAKSWKEGNSILYIPIVLLILFFLGYMAVGLFGKPDLIVGGILFGGSIFVLVMYLLLTHITRRIIDSEKLEVELKAAEESNRAKTTFLAGISHEMRTPMNAILGLTGMALKKPDLPADMAALLTKIDKSARHLLGLISDILDLQRIETGEIIIKNEVFSLQDMLDQVNVIAESLATDKGLNYQVTIDEKTMGDYMGDPTLTQRALLRVLDNAVKYTEPPGTVHLSVRCVSVSGSSRTLEFSVTDTGIGIEAAFLPNVFEVFAQEDSSYSNRHGGSGTGMAVTKKTLNCLGGDITVESVKNEGSTFTIVLPLVCVHREQIRPVKQAPVMPEGLEGCRILIVEDIEVNAEIVVDLLELEGAESEVAINGQVAVDMVSSSAEKYYDAVLMDLRMPIMDGLEAARSIRKLDRQDVKRMPIIALSANAFDTDIQNSMDAGMNAHLAKPVDADKLYATLKQWIHKARIREEM